MGNRTFAKRVGERLRRCLRDRGGTTIIETLVAVVVVMLVLGLFSQIVTASAKMFASSNAIIERNETFNESFYKKESIAARKPVAKGMRIQLVTDHPDYAKPLTGTVSFQEKGVLKRDPDKAGTGLTMYVLERQP